MDSPSQHYLVSCDTLRNGLIVTVGNRVPSFYPAAALYVRTPSEDEVIPSEKDLQISSVDRMEDGVLIIEFSDGSIATYTVAELLQLRPDRAVPKNDQFD